MCTLNDKWSSWILGIFLKSTLFFASWEISNKSLCIFLTNFNDLFIHIGFLFWFEMCIYCFCQGITHKRIDTYAEIHWRDLSYLDCVKISKLEIEPVKVQCVFIGVITFLWLQAGRESVEIKEKGKKERQRQVGRWMSQWSEGDMTHLENFFNLCWCLTLSESHGNMKHNYIFDWKKCNSVHSVPVDVITDEKGETLERRKSGIQWRSWKI